MTKEIRGSDDGGYTYEEWRCYGRVWDSIVCLDPERRARAYAKELRRTGQADPKVERRMIIKSAWVEL